MMRIGRQTSIYSLLSFFNAGIAFVRDIFLAAFIGTSIIADIFLVSLRIPLSFRRSISEEAFNSSFIPIFNELANNDDQRLKYDFSKKILIIFLFIFLAIVLLGELFMPKIVTIFSNGISNEKDLKILIDNSRIIFPYLLFIIISSVFIGILNSEKKFFLTAFLPTILHLSIILSIYISEFFNLFDIRILSIGVLISGFIQCVILFFSVEKEFWSHFFKINVPDIYLKRFLLSVSPSIATSLLSQFNLLIGLVFASMSAGAVSYLYYAERLYLIPFALIAIPLSRIIIPSINETIRTRSIAALKEIQTASIKYLSMLIVPTSFCMFFISETLIQVFFERGEFDSLSTEMASNALRIFLLGLFPSCLIRLLTPYFFAVEKSNTPLKLGLKTTALNLLLMLCLHPIIGYLAIPFSISIASWFNLLLYHFEYRRINFQIFDYKLATFLLRQVIVSLILLLAIFLSENFLNIISVHISLFVQLLLVTSIWITYIYNFDQVSKDFLIHWLEIRKRTR